MPEEPPQDRLRPLDLLARHLACLARRAEQAGLGDARDLLRDAERAVRDARRDEES